MLCSFHQEGTNLALILKNDPGVTEHLMAGPAVNKLMHPEALISNAVVVHRCFSMHILDKSFI